MSEVTLTRPAVAKLLMLSERRVSQLVAKGELPREERGRYELVSVIQGYIRFLHRVSAGRGTGSDDGARLMKAKADLAEMSASQMASELVPAHVAEETWQGAVERIRARTLQVSGKAAPLVAASDDTQACHEIIESFVHEALADISATPVDTAVAASDTDHGIE